jgi:hypothetical protein
MKHGWPGGGAGVSGVLCRRGARLMGGLGDQIHKRRPSGLRDYLEHQSSHAGNRPRANGASWYKQLEQALAAPSGASSYLRWKPRIPVERARQTNADDRPLIDVGQSGVDTDNDNYPRNSSCTTASYNCLSNLPPASRMSCIVAENACKRVSFAARSFPSNVPFLVNYPDGGRVVIQGGTGTSLYIPPRPNIRGQ